MPRSARTLLALSLLAITALPAAGQTGSRLWGGVGAALGTPGIGLVFDGSLASGVSLWQARIALHAPFMSTDPDDPVLSEFAVMAGRGRGLGNGIYGSVAGGLALVSGERSAEDTFETVGIAAEARIIAPRIPRLAIALQGNLNPERSFAALVGSIQLGGAPYW